jgi:hypothetical protein
LIRQLALVVALTGCDVVFGLDDQPRACSLPGFDPNKPTDVLPEIYAYAISADQSRVVAYSAGLDPVPHAGMFEFALPAGTMTQIDLGIYTPVTVALAPEGDALLYSAAIEPPLLQAAVRTGDATWSLDQPVPLATYAGTPSAAEFGPRRVLARLRDGRPDVQEYEEQGGKWVAIGASHTVSGAYAPNLTPDGLAMVFGDVVGIWAATRKTMDDWFGDPVTVLGGVHTRPQLVDKCRRLYVLDDTTLRSYE